MVCVCGGGVDVSTVFLAGLVACWQCWWTLKPLLMLEACPECILSHCLPISHYRKVGGSKNKEVTSLQGCLHRCCLPGRGWYFKPVRVHIFTPLSLTDLAIWWGEEAWRPLIEKRRGSERNPSLLLDKKERWDCFFRQKTAGRVPEERETELRKGGDGTWGRWTVARLSWLPPPEEELQLSARAGPRAGRAGPTASPPLFFSPQSLLLLLPLTIN